MVRITYAESAWKSKNRQFAGLWRLAGCLHFQIKSHTLTQHLDLDVPSGRVFLSILRLACIRSGVGGPLGVLNHQGSVGINSLPPIDGQHRSVYEAIQIGLE
jgi:hypothetical protein